MKVQHVSIRPTEAAQQAGRPSLTPELLAASGARYSRNDEGLDSILSKIDFGNEEDVTENILDWVRNYDREEYGSRADINSEIYVLQEQLEQLRKPQLEKGVDGIFKMIDYGHQSIADMAPVAMFMDGISIFAAYYIWSLCPVAGGQESSTRYIKMNVDGLIDPNSLGIPQDEQEMWLQNMHTSFKAYEQAVKIWEAVADESPSLMRIPKRLLNSENEKDQKQVERMKRNFVFDRARVFIPVAAATNVMMIQSARAWVTLSSHLLSHPLEEFKKLGEAIRDELLLVTPRLHKHARFNPNTNAVIEDEFAKARKLLMDNRYVDQYENSSRWSRKSEAYFESYEPSQQLYPNYAHSLKHRSNRYSLIGSDLSRVAVRYGWKAVAMAEIRDMNRHRTGYKYCPLAPLGMYGAEDQLPQLSENKEYLSRLVDVAGDLLGNAQQKMLTGDPTYIYDTLLGFQFPFEQTTTADKFVYTAELRTGIGAHYRYAEHFRNVLEIAYKQLTGLEGFVFEGSAEPE